MTSSLIDILQSNLSIYRPVIALNGSDRIHALDLSENNSLLIPDTISDTNSFSVLIDKMLAEAKCQYGIGGYNELRNLYARSVVFDGAEPRRLHLGVDVWGPAGTPVFAPLAGTIHSFAYNGSFGDYGATIILQHELNGYIFHTLYGHLSLASLQGKTISQTITAGEQIADFGAPVENGAWPPHLHFQVIENMEGMMGDYPGVCRFSEREKYLANCPDANILLPSLKKHII